jgi:hypothetical protein
MRSVESQLTRLAALEKAATAQFVARSIKFILSVKDVKKNGVMEQGAGDPAKETFCVWNPTVLMYMNGASSRY